jgi:predicted Na+-dependent transporter
MPRAHLQALNQYRELALVVVAAVIGLTVQSPLAWVVHHQGVDIFLAILVFATAITIEPESLRRLPAVWRHLAAALLVGVTILPALSWAVAHLVAAGSLRDGITTMGLAPCEIASIATTAMASGDIAFAGGILIGSTILTVSVAGPILALEVPGVSIHPGHIIVNLLIVVALPLAAGIAARAFLRLPAATESVASTTSVLAVAVLVALIAAEVHLSLHYLPVLAAIVLFVLASALVGRLLGRAGGPSVMKALLLTTSMRDFAIAAGVATAAFGAPAAAPLGLYGIIVLIWGTGAAGYLRKRTSVAT